MAAREVIPKFPPGFKYYGALPHGRDHTTEGALFGRISPKDYKLVNSGNYSHNPALEHLQRVGEGEGGLPWVARQILRGELPLWMTEESRKALWKNGVTGPEDVDVMDFLEGRSGERRTEACKLMMAWWRRNRRMVIARQAILFRRQYPTIARVGRFPKPVRQLIGAFLWGASAEMGDETDARLLSISGYFDGCIAAGRRRVLPVGADLGFPGTPTPMHAYVPRFKKKARGRGAKLARAEAKRMSLWTPPSGNKWA